MTRQHVRPTSVGKRSWRVLLPAVLCAAAALPTDAAPITQPSADVFLDNVLVVMPQVTVSPIPNTDRWLLTSAIATPDFAIDLHVESDPDPYITWGTTIQNYSHQTQTYSLHFISPVAPGWWDHAIATLSASATDGNTHDGVTIGLSPGQSTFATAFGNPSNFDLLVGIGTTCVSAGGSRPCQDYAPVSSWFPAQMFSQVDVYLNFTLTGDLDVAGFNGRVDLLHTPEPGTAVLAAAALGLFAAARAASRRGKGTL